MARGAQLSGASPDLGLLWEIAELKRVRAAERDGSVAARLFARAWSRVVRGAPDAWADALAEALVAARLGDVDAATMRALGMSEGDIASVFRATLASFDDVPGGAGETRVEAMLRDEEAEAIPAFVARLAAQPRAGITCPGRPRLAFWPTENHAEHCLAVALFGVLLASRYEADPETVFLAGLAHHLHNAWLPDGGYTGEMLLGAHLAPLMAAAASRALDELPAPCRDRVERARACLADAETPEGRAFHAADALDRVMQAEYHLRPGSLALPTVLQDMALVHEGPVKRFQDGVLAAYGFPCG